MISYKRRTRRRSLLIEGTLRAGVIFRSLLLSIAYLVSYTTLFTPGVTNTCDPATVMAYQVLNAVLFIIVPSLLMRKCLPLVVIADDAVTPGLFGLVKGQVSMFIK